MNKKLNTQFMAALVITAVLFYSFGLGRSHGVKQENSSLAYVNTTVASFQMNEARYLAYQLLEPKQFGCLDFILTHESHWNPKARNKKSSAKGIGQLLNQTYTNIGMKHSSDPRAQMIATLSYISRWYGSAGPCGAKRHWVKHKWY